MLGGEGAAMVLGHSVCSVWTTWSVKPGSTASTWASRRDVAGRVPTVPGGPELELTAGGVSLLAVSDRVAAPAIPIFHVDDVHGLTGRAAEFGGSVVNAPFLIRDIWLASIADPAGHIIGLSSANQAAG